MKKIQFVLQIAISAACLAALIFFIHPSQLWEVVCRARPGSLVVVFLLMPPAILARVLRWRYILASKGVSVPVASMSRVVFIAQALNLFLPASLGDLASSYYGWRVHGNKEAMLASAMADKMTGLLTLCLLGIGCALAIGKWYLALVTAAFTAPLIAVVLFPRIIPWRLAAWLFRKLLRKEMNTERLHRTSSLGLKTVGIAMAISIVGWGFTNLMYYFACLAFTAEVSLAYIFAVAPLVNLMRIVPVTVAGLGSADMLIVFLFGLAGVASTDAFAASMAVNLSLLILPGLIGLVSILLERGKPPSRAPTLLRESLPINHRARDCAPQPVAIYNDAANCQENSEMPQADGRSYYEVNYTDYELQTSPHKLEFYLGLLRRSVAPGRPIFELGVGKGHFLERACAEYTCRGCDVDPDGLAAARERLPGVAIEEGSFDRIPREPPPAAVVAWDVLEHIPDLNAALDTIRERLAQDGVLVGVVPVYDGPLGWLVRRLDHDPTHRWKLPRRDWLRLLLRHRFEVIEWGGIIRRLLWRHFYLHLTWPQWLLRRIGSAAYFIARKGS